VGAVLARDKVWVIRLQNRGALIAGKHRSHKGFRYSPGTSPPIKRRHLLLQLTQQPAGADAQLAAQAADDVDL